MVEIDGDPLLDADGDGLGEFDTLTEAVADTDLVILALNDGLGVTVDVELVEGLLLFVSEEELDADKDIHCVNDGLTVGVALGGGVMVREWECE